MRILVSGGAGFIGSHSVEALLEAGHQLEVIDNLSSGRADRLPAGVPLHVLDIRSPEAALALEDFAPQALLHLAAQMDVRRSVEDPLFDADVNLRGSLNLLEACKRAGTKRVVFSSTGGAIYGEQHTFPATEDHPRQPMSPYGCAKAAVETYLAYYRVVHGLSTQALRYANVYGPRQDPKGEAGVVAIFCGRLLRGKTCTVYGEGKPTRDYVFVSDVARANRLALEGQGGEATNIGTGVETSTLALYHLLREAAGSELEPLLAEGRRGEQLRSVIDPSLAASGLGWRPQVSLQPGLKQTLAWAKTLI